MEREAKRPLAMTFVLAYGILYAFTVGFSLLYCGITYAGISPSIVYFVQAPAFGLVLAFLASTGTALLVTRSWPRVLAIGASTSLLAYLIGRAVPSKLFSTPSEFVTAAFLGVAACWIPVVFVALRKRSAIEWVTPPAVALGVSLFSALSVVAQPMALTYLSSSVVNTFLLSHTGALRYATAWVLAAWLMRLAFDRRPAVVSAHTA